MFGWSDPASSRRKCPACFCSDLTRSPVLGSPQVPYGGTNQSRGETQALLRAGILSGKAAFALANQGRKQSRRPTQSPRERQCSGLPIWSLFQSNKPDLLPRKYPLRSRSIGDDYGALQSLVSCTDRTIGIRIVVEEWDRIGQFYASLESGHTTASVALKRLVAFSGKNRFYRGQPGCLAATAYQEIWSCLGVREYRAATIETRSGFRCGLAQECAAAFVWELPACPDSECCPGFL